MMKSAVLFLSMILTGLVSAAQTDKYTAAMSKNIAMLDSAMSKNTMPDLANNFTRIADAEKTQWLPYYYAAYCTVMSAFTENDKSKTDDIASRADELLTKAEGLAGKPNSETHVVRSMIASAHMMVDPQTRWQQYGAQATEHINLAKELDPTNPRPVFLEAQAKFYTPESFGGGKAPAKELFEKSIQMFDSFQPKAPLDPVWGKATAEYFLAQTK